jgi:hypothetical protein
MEGIMFGRPQGAAWKTSEYDAIYWDAQAKKVRDSDEVVTQAPDQMLPVS